MTQVFVYVRIALAICTALGTVLLMVPVHFSGFKVKGIRLSSWCIVPGLWLLNKIWRVTVHCDQPEKMRNHTGLILSNHQSYLDITSLYSIAPARYLAAGEVRDRPILGWMSKANGTVFVDRGSIKSAVAMREQIADAVAAEPHPPFIMYPEGKLGTADGLNKFRRGTFRIAIENELPYLLCAIRYDTPDVTTWHGGRGESMLGAIVRLFEHAKPVSAEVIVLDTITPTATDNPQQLALQAREIIGTALGFEIE